MAGWITIDLKGLRFFGEHGMYPEEMKVGNEFEVDLSLSFKAPKGVITSLEETINYVEVYRIIQEELADRKQLLETCAMKIGERLNEQFPQVRSVSVTIKKISPPITNFSGTIGVTFAREYKS